PQRLFGTFAFSDIDDGAHELDKMTGFIANRMTYSMNIPDRTARMNDSIVGFELRFVANRVFKQSPDPDLVLRTKALKKCLKSWRPSHGIKTAPSVSFPGPIPDFPGSRRPYPAPGMAEPLRFREIRFALASGRFREL